MNKEQFFKELKKALKNIPEHELEEILYDYKEHFLNAEKDGKTQEEIIAELGNPREIALQFSASNYIESARENFNVKNIFMAILALCGLGLFNIIFVLPIFIAILFVLFIMWSGSIFSLIGGIVTMGIAFLFPIILSIGLFATGLGSVYMIVFGIFAAGLGITSFSIAIILIMIYITKFIYNKTLDYLSVNLELIKQK